MGLPRRIVFFTGAGMSAESGVPTYRGKGGVWREYDYRRYACQAAFDADPEGVWEFHNYRRAIVGACTPNDGHRRVAGLSPERHDVTVVTQNIDGLHQLAGSERVLELHGSLWRVRCPRCGARHEGREQPLAELRCRSCVDSWWRPDIVWFGDVLDAAVVEAALQAITSCDLLVSVGTSAAVYPAAEMPLQARRGGAELVEINPEPTPLSHIYDRCLRGPATEMLAELLG